MGTLALAHVSGQALAAVGRECCQVVANTSLAPGGLTLVWTTGHAGALQLLGIAIKSWM